MKKASSLIVQIAPGGKLSVSVNTALDRVYREICITAYQNSQDEPTNIIHGIKTIIFGCFWLEAVTNKLVPLVLKNEIHNEMLRKILWDSFKKANFQEKLKVISTIGGNQELVSLPLIAPKLKSVFDLRNRLAHFKDDDQLVIGNLPLDDLENLFDDPPESDLIKYLTRPKLKEYVNIIEEGGAWLTLVEEKYMNVEKEKTAKDGS